MDPAEVFLLAVESRSLSSALAWIKGVFAQGPLICVPAHTHMHMYARMHCVSTKKLVLVLMVLRAEKTEAQLVILVV